MEAIENSQLNEQKSLSFDALLTEGLASETLSQSYAYRLVLTLIESGHYRKAGQLLLSSLDSPIDAALRSALQAYSRIFLLGQPTEHVEELERLASLGTPKIHDQIRIRELYSRAVAIAVSFNALPQSYLNRARYEMSRAVDGWLELDEFESYARARIHLAQFYSVGAWPDNGTARTLLELVISDTRIGAEYRIDAKRRLVELDYTTGNSSTKEIAIRREFSTLEKEALDAGFVIQSGLVLVSLSRTLKNRSLPVAHVLERAERLFVDNNYPIGVFEVCMNSASLAVESGHLVKARRLFESATATAVEIEFIEGQLVSDLALIQVLISQSERKLAEERAESVLKLKKDLPSFGLSIAAIYQLLGELERARKVAASAELYYRQLDILDLVSQSIFMQGACLAGQNRWDKARVLWQKAQQIDHSRGDKSGEIEKLLSIAQAITLNDFTATKSVSDQVMAKVAEKIALAESLAKNLPIAGERLRLLGRTSQTSAQLKMVARRPLMALKDFSMARDAFVQLAARRDVAFIDAVMGFALLETGRAGKSGMFEEALEAFKRSLDYFSSEQILAVRWKIFYYLALTSFLIAKSEAGRGTSLFWINGASEWLEAAVLDANRVKEAGIINAGENEISPGLAYESLDALAKELSTAVEQTEEPTKTIFIKGRKNSEQMH